MNKRLSGKPRFKYYISLNFSIRGGLGIKRKNLKSPLVRYLKKTTIDKD